MSTNNSTTNVHPTKIKRAGWLNEFMWSCAGVNKKVLRQCPSDYSKYAGIGGMILFTAIMAALSGGYAMYFVFHDEPITTEGLSTITQATNQSNNSSLGLAIAFGIFWGLLIFNLDRFIVNTMYSDGKHTISWGEIKSGLPRIIMAIFLGLVISTPLEMKIFSDQIDTQVKIDNGKREEKIKKENHVLYEDLNKAEAQLQRLMDEKKELEDKLNKAQIAYDDEITGPHRGIGPIAAELKQHVEECKKAITRWEATNSSDIERYQNDINNAKARINDLNNQIINDRNLNGFAIRYEAFKNVTDWDEHPALAVVSLMITLLFVIIETAPTFLKMMMEDGPYDDLLRAEKHKAKVLADKSISDVNDAVNTCVRISTMKNEKRLEAETIANADIMAKIASAQAELLEIAIAGWKEKELEKIRQNPSDYVVTLVPPKQEMTVVADEEGNLSEFHPNHSNVNAHVSNEHIERAGTVNLHMTPEEIINNANEDSEVVKTEEESLYEENLSEEEPRPSFWKRLFRKNR